MPIYEFYCANCRSKFEVLTNYEASQGHMPCTACGSANVRKLLSLVARRVHSADGDFDAFSDLGEREMDDMGDDFGGDDGCGCGGGACNCHN